MRALTWTAYLLMACEGYLIYVVGFITPYLERQLAVAPWVAALPNSALAAGVAVAGVVADRATRRFGPRAAVRMWSGLMGLAGVLLAVPVSIAPILVGAFAFGMSVGGMLVHVNSALGAGPRGGTLLMRANLWSMTGGLAGPLLLAAAAGSIGWWFGPLAPVPFLVALVFVLPASPARDVHAATGPGEDVPAVAEGPGEPRTGHPPPPALPRPYWQTWGFLTLAIGAEFSFVTWGSQVVTARTGIAITEATSLASLYVVGMVAGRLALSAGHGSACRRLAIMRGGTALALVGAGLVWLAPNPVVAGLGLLLGGLGGSSLYPLAASLALAHAPSAPVRASARLTTTTAIAIFCAPLGLGLATGAVGVTAAWLLVFAMLGAALLVVLRIPQPRERPLPAPVGA